MDFFDHGYSRFIPGILDLVIMGTYLALMFLVAHMIQQRNVEKNPAYRYYKAGLFMSILATILFCMVYTLYYKEGADTNMFFRNSQSLVKLLLRDPIAYLRLFFGERSPEVYYLFDNETGWPWMFRDPESFAVVRFTSPFTLLGLGNFYTTSILVAWFSYTGIWRLYLLFCHHYPAIHKHLAWAILFYPSVAFWGSPILKDTFSVMAMGFFVYSFYFGLVQKQNIFRHILIMIVSAYVIMMVKPYILVALMPGAFVWLSFNWLKKLENPVMRWAVAPAAVMGFLVAAIVIIGFFSTSLGEYGSLDSIIRKAQITQDDLMRAEAYSENFFDIGRIDGTTAGFIRLAPAAIVAGIFRPFLWDVRNILMLLAGVENTLMMIIFTVIIWRTGIVKGIKIVANEPLVIFSILFAILFAFSVGVTTANFGALVRLRIPLLPFFAGALAIMYHLSLEYKKEKQEKESQTQF